MEIGVKYLEVPYFRHRGGGRKFSVVLSPTIQGILSIAFPSLSSGVCKHFRYTMMPNLGSKTLQASPISIREFYNVFVPLYTGVKGKRKGKNNVQAPTRRRIGISCRVSSLSKPLSICRHRCQWGRRLYGFDCSLCCSQNIPTRQAELQFRVSPYRH